MDYGRQIYQELVDINSVLSSFSSSFDSFVSWVQDTFYPVFDALQSLLTFAVWAGLAVAFAFLVIRMFFPGVRS